MSFELAKQYFVQGLAELEQGALAAAEASFGASLALLPDRPSSLINLGAVRLALGKAAEALPLLEAACRLDETNAQAWSCRGKVLIAMNRKPQALPFLERAVALEPGNAELWLHYAEVQQDLQLLPQALASLDRALALDGNNAIAWSNRGMLLRELQRPKEAAASFEEALARGADASLNQFYLASVRSGTHGDAAQNTVASQGAAGVPASVPVSLPTSAPRAYVEQLFDSYADDFAIHLVQALHYRGHERLVERLVQLHPGRFDKALDIGCGSGLCGPLLRPRCGRLDGLDISSAMVEKARQTGMYDHLFHADAVEYLRASSSPRPYDLILAADVFNYVGALEPVFAAVHKALAAGGRFCFTVEAIDEAQVGANAVQDGAADLQLLPSLRYAHSEPYVRRVANTHGYAIDEISREALREDQGGVVSALYVFLTRT